MILFVVDMFPYTDDINLIVTRHVERRTVLNTLKEEVEALNKKLHELTEEELAQVTGGADPAITEKQPEVEARGHHILKPVIIE